MEKNSNARGWLTSFVLGISLLLSCGMFTGCSKDDDNDDNVTPDCIQGQGAVETRTLSIAGFSGVDLASSFDVTIKQGTPQAVKATGHGNIIDKIKTSVVDSVWRVELEKGCYSNFELSIEITIPNINQLKVSGSGIISVDDFANQSDLSMQISGNGSITLNKFEGITKLDVALSGSGNVTANNDISTLRDLNVTISGLGNYLGFNISCDHATVNSLGGGKSELTVNATLNATINGVGNVYYKGTPNITRNGIGLGSLVDAN